MPNEEQIPVYRRGERVDVKAKGERVPQATVADDGITLEVPQRPQPKKKKKVPIKKGMVS